MNKRLKPLIAALVLLLLTIVIYTPSDSRPFPNQPIAEQGVLNASLWSFSQHGTFRLDGEWEVYWNRLLEPDHFKERQTLKPDYYPVPKTWDPRSGKDFATFRLLIRLPEENGVIALRIPPVASAYKLWINGQAVATSGSVDSDQAGTVPEQSVRIVYFQPSGTNAEIVFHISNFTHRKGGIWNSIEIGLDGQIARSTTLRSSLDAFFFGCLVLAGVYHISLYLFRKKNKSALYFGLYCFITSTLLLFAGEVLLALLAPDFPWEIARKTEYIGMAACVPVFLRFLYHSYPAEVSGRWIRLMDVLAVAAFLTVAVFPAIVYTQLFFLFQAYVLSSVLYMMFVLLQAVRRHRKGAILFGTAGAVYALTVLNDVLYFNGLLQTGSLSPYGLFIFVIVQTCMLSRTFSDASAKVEELTQKLLSADRLKDEFLTHTSHELSVPLGTIARLAESMNVYTMPMEGSDQSLQAFGHLHGQIVQDGQSKARSPHILIVDDEPDNLQLLCNQLSLEPYSISTATSGLQAIRTISESNSVDLIILDAFMPKMSGFEVCRTIRSHYSLMDLPIMMLYTEKKPEIIYEGFNAGINDYMVKPIDKKELLTRVKTLLTLKKAIREANQHTGELEKLNKQLTELNNSLEEKIADRTLSLQQSKQQLEEMNEDLERIERSRIRLLTNISHDLRTPITSIQGYIEAILDGVVTDPDNMNKYLRLIHSKSLTLNRLIQDLFELAQLESRQAAFRMREVPAIDLVRQVKEKFELDVGAHGIRFEVQNALDRPVVLNVDADRLDQVFANLIFNALKYTPQDGVLKICFEKKTGRAFKDELVVKVSDSGSGIAKEDLPYIFDRFYKGTPRNNSSKSSGLGLAITKEIVEYHGGRIWAESDTGQGCTISFTLPIFY